MRMGPILSLPKSALREMLTRAALAAFAIVGVGLPAHFKI
jgi:hypothetical protein